MSQTTGKAINHTKIKSYKNVLKYKSSRWVNLQWGSWMSMVISWTLLPEMQSIQVPYVKPNSSLVLVQNFLDKSHMKKTPAIFAFSLQAEPARDTGQAGTIPVMFWSKDGTAGSEGFHIFGLVSSRRTEKLPFCLAAGGAESSSSDQLCPILRVCWLFPVLWLKPSYLQWSINISNQQLSPLSWSVCCHFSLSAMRFRHINNNVC